MSFVAPLNETTKSNQCKLFVGTSNRRVNQSTPESHS